MAAVMVVMMVAVLAFSGQHMMMGSHDASQEKSQSHQHGSESEKTGGDKG